MKSFVLIIIVLGLISCKEKTIRTSQTSDHHLKKVDSYYQSKFSYISIDTIDFDKIKYIQTAKGEECNLKAIDSVDTKLWTCYT